MHPFPILERWMSKDIVVERHNNTPSLSTSAVSATSKTSKSSQNNTMSKCPYMNLNSANEDSVGSMIDDDDDDNDDKDDDDCRADMNMKNIHSMHMHKEVCTSPKNTQITPTTTATPTLSTSTHTSTAARPFVIQKNTQIVMFPSDWKHDQSWSVFGAGKRACPGTYCTLYYQLYCLPAILSAVLPSCCSVCCTAFLIVCLHAFILACLYLCVSLPMSVFCWISGWF